MQDIKIENVTLKMWEKTMMPVSEKVDGKYVKTGEKEEQTTYTFIDEWGNKLVFLSNDINLRKQEGNTGHLLVSLSHDNFKKTNKIQYKGFLS